jgi:hypothetical protein
MAWHALVTKAFMTEVDCKGGEGLKKLKQLQA